MRDRRGLPWMLGLGLVAAAGAALAMGLSWWGADLQSQANRFYSSQNDGSTVSQAEYDYWNSISSNGYALHTLAGPLLIGTLVALFALLAVLARLWELARRSRATDARSQPEATAAS